MSGFISSLNDCHRQHGEAVGAWHRIRERLPERIDPNVGGLTICSVAYRAKRCLEVNDRLMRTLNGAAASPEWLLFDNNVDAEEMIAGTDSRFTVVRPERRTTNMGYEHALGISELMSRVRTRFLLILDPDCFIVFPDWLRVVPEYMAAKGLGFFGTPINPRRHNSYRYFPYMVCMFVDLSRVSPRDLCFIPDIWERRTNVTYRMRKMLATLPKAGVLFRWLLTEQWRTNGWQIKTRFGDGHVPFDCAQPVWDIDAELAQSAMKSMLHAITPAAVSPIPKRRGYCSPNGFRSMGAPDVASFGWEEFIWQRQPFAFHIGSVHAAAGDYVTRLSSVVDGFEWRSELRCPA